MAVSGLSMDTYPYERLIAVEAATEGAVVDALVNRVFGPGRYVKTAERLREGNQPYPDLCFVSRQRQAGAADRVIGSVRLWPVTVCNQAGQPHGELAFLGPIAVEGEYQSFGIGRALVETAIHAAFAQALTGILLVGTPSYFEKFGFEKAEGLTLPGPVDYRRVMVLYNPAHHGASLSGSVVAGAVAR